MKKIVFVLFALLLILAGCDTEPQEGHKDEPGTKDPTLVEKELTLVQGETVEIQYDAEKVEIKTKNDGIQIDGNKLTCTLSGNLELSYLMGDYFYSYKLAVIPEKLQPKKDSVVIMKGSSSLAEVNTNSKVTLNYASLNENVATINSDGVISGMSLGTCQVQISTPYNTAVVEVEVLDTANTCAINENVIEMEVGKPQYLLIDSANSKNENVTFTCNQTLLEISEHGIITPVKAGTEKITVKDSKGVTKEMTVNIIEKFEEIHFNKANEINVYGRVSYDTNNNKLTVYHSASGFECTFEGTYFKATIESTCSLSPYAYIKVYLDDTEYSIGLDKNGAAEYTIAEGLENKVHTIKVLKRVEESTGKLVISNLKADLFLTPPKKPELLMEVYGDSYTAGYGVLGKSTDAHTATTDDPTLSYAYVASQKLNAQLNVCCYSGISMGIKGWIKDFFLPDVAPYLAYQTKIPWDFSQYQADIIIVYLGTNDNYGLKQNFGTAKNFDTKYKAFLNFLLENTPNAKIICCYGFSAIDTSLENSIKGLPKTHPNQVFTFKLPASTCSGSNGHPNAADQAKGGTKLAEYIENTILPLINSEESSND